MQRLSTEEKKRLIYLVEQNPILYDTSHEDFFDVKKKDKIWDYIGQALGIHRDLARKLWKNLRDSFRKNIRLYSSEAADIGADPSLPPPITYKYANEIQFITPFIKPRNYGATSKSSINSDEGKVDDGAALWDALELDHSDQEDSLIPLVTRPSPRYNIRRKQSPNLETNDQDVQTKSLECSRGREDEVNFFEGETEMLKFFESIATIAGHFPSRIRSTLRFKISQLIYETECQINSSDAAALSNSTLPSSTL